MRIAVLGTGVVGRTLAGALVERGHRVSIGTRDVAVTLARTSENGFGAWASAHRDVAVARFDEAVREADLVVNALSGSGSMDGIAAARIPDRTVLLDVSNPLATGAGRPAGLFVTNTDSLAEQLQRRFSSLRVVKSLHTMTARLMVAPRELADGDLTTFVCGDDAEAKELVVGVLVELGHRDVVDLGDLSAARGTEALMLVWLRLYPVVGSAMFTFKVVR